jgi:hypothetical protein
MRTSFIVLGAVPFAFCFSLMSACGSDGDSPTRGTLDASTGLDGSGEPNGSTSDGDTGAGDTATDAAKDSAPITNASTWTVASGLPDTTCTPWMLVDTADPENPVLAAGKLTISTSTDGENVYYRQTDIITPAELVIEVRVKLLSGSASTPSRAPVFVSYHYGAAKHKNTLFLAEGEAFLLTEENTKGASAAVATTDAAHDYKLVTNTTTHAVEVFRDNVSILTGTAFAEANDPSAVADIAWGEASSLANGIAEWERVKHNAHSPTTCP